MTCAGECLQVNIVRWSLANLCSVELGSVVRGAKQVRVVSIGGGIGSELLGLAVSLSEREQAECRIRASFLEPHNTWESERHAVCAAVACGGWNTEVCSVEMRGDPSVADLHARQAHLLCLVHCLSILPGDLCAQWLPRVLAMAQPGAVVLLVDFQGQRMVNLSQVVCRAGFESMFASPLHAPGGLGGVPKTEQANLLASFEGWEKDWGSLPLLKCSSYVQVFVKSQRLHHLGSKRPALEPLPLTPAIHRVNEDRSPFHDCHSAPSRGLLPFCAPTLAGTGVGIGISARSPASPRESGEIESSEAEDSLSIGEVRTMTKTGEEGEESPENTVQRGTLSNGVMAAQCHGALHALQNTSRGMQAAQMEELSPGTGGIPRTDSIKDADDPNNTSDLTIGIQLFAKYMVGSQEVVANSFSEAKKRVLVEKPTNATQTEDQTESTHGEQNPKVLQWVSWNQRPQKKSKAQLSDGFMGRFQKNEEPQQTQMMYCRRMETKPGMGSLSLTNKENSLSISEGQMMLVKTGKYP